MERECERVCVCEREWEKERERERERKREREREKKEKWITYCPQSQFPFRSIRNLRRRCTRGGWSSWARRSWRWGTWYPDPQEECRRETSSGCSCCRPSPMERSPLQVERSGRTSCRRHLLLENLSKVIQNCLLKCWKMYTFS